MSAMEEKMVNHVERERHKAAKAHKDGERADRQTDRPEVIRLDGQ